MRDILIDHYQRYPLMRTEDFIKLIYQQCFGPRHFTEDPDRTQVTKAIEAEIHNNDCSMSTGYEGIGNGYVRVHLDTVVRGQLSLDTLVTAFIKTAMEPLDADHARRAFLSGVELFRHLVGDGTIDLPYLDVEEVLDQYLEGNLRPVRHSDTFRQVYCPHYRVVRLSYLKHT